MMSRGGRRPGAGAPKGNLNALKTGQYSKQFARIGRLLAAEPRFRAQLLDIGAKLELEQQKATDIAAALLAMTIERARNQARHGLNLDLPSHEWDSIRGAARRLTGGQYGNLPAEAFQPEEKTQYPGDQSKTQPKRRISISRQIQKPID
jgi:hypothetical protein